MTTKMGDLARIRWIDINILTILKEEHGNVGSIKVGLGLAGRRGNRCVLRM